MNRAFAAGYGIAPAPAQWQVAFGLWMAGMRWLKSGERRRKAPGDTEQAHGEKHAATALRGARKLAILGLWHYAKHNQPACHGEDEQSGHFPALQWDVPAMDRVGKPRVKVTGFQL